VLRGGLCGADRVLLASAGFKVLANVQRRSPREVISVLSVRSLFRRRDCLILNLIYPLELVAYLSWRLVSNLSVASFPELLLQINTAVILRH
jgi:hypothetical protein